MVQEVTSANVNRDDMRAEIKAKYTEVALAPGKGFLFHTLGKDARLPGRGSRVAACSDGPFVRCYGNMPLNASCIRIGYDRIALRQRCANRAASFH